jgi:hypothetical protein
MKLSLVNTLSVRSSSKPATENWLWGLLLASLLNVAAPTNAETLATAQDSLQFFNFSHSPESVAQFKSVFAHLISEGGGAIAMTDPPFVTGNYQLWTLTPRFPVFLQSIPGGESALAPLSFPQVNGWVRGSSSTLFSEGESQQLVAVNLSSETQLWGGELPFLVSAIGQSGFQASFSLKNRETFSVDFQSLFALQSRTNLSNLEGVEFSEERVIYFYAKPADINFDHAILIFSLYPQTRIAVNDSRIDVGLIEVSSQSSNSNPLSWEITGNSIPLDLPYYFQIAGQPSLGHEQNFQGSFTYFADKPTILTLVAYTSSSTLAYRYPVSPSSADPVPEPSPLFGAAIALGFAVLSKCSWKQK